MRLYHLKLIPHVYTLKRSKNRSFVYADIQRWLNCMKIEFDIYKGFKFLMYNYPEFRSLFYYRIGGKKLLKFLLPEMPNLYIYTKEIGKGLFIQHGFSTIILAKTIGENCWVNQQVTIGYTYPPWELRIA